VVVTLNYRLGPFGYLALSELESEDAAHPSTGEYGLEDQRAALAWVKSNAAAFGGDPGNVTVFGESAGGISVCHHMVSPKSKGLFERAIIESGPCDTLTSKDEATTQGIALATALGCTGPDVLACLRGKSTEEIMTALPTGTDLVFGTGAQWFPVLDGWNLPDMPSKLLEAQSFEKVPTILGANADEGTLFFALANTPVPDEATFELLAEQLVPGHGKEVVAHYPPATYGSVQKAASAAVGDAGFVCPTRKMARAFAKAGVPTFLYHFTYAPTGALLSNLGAFHSAEVKYVFGNPYQLAPQALTDEELALSAELMGYWSRHADKGDPNGEGAFAWPKYDAQKDEAILLDMTLSTKAGIKKDLCDFWDPLNAGI
jgi:para-nitrobenzyl esterase